MRKWTSVSLAFLLLFGNGIPVQAEDVKETVHVYVHAAQDDTIPCRDAEYAVYHDAAAQQPFIDAGGQQVTMHTNEQGEATAELEQPFFLKLKTPAKGYYSDPTITAGGSDLRFSQWPIRLVFTSDEREFKMNLLAEDNVSVPLDQAEAGRVYQAVDSQSVDYRAAKAVPVTIPLYRDEKNDPMVIATEEVTYGKAHITFKAEEEMISGVKFEIYHDEACTQKAVDLFHTGDMITDENGAALSLETGRYFLKVTDLSVKYGVISSLQMFEITAGKDTEVNVACQKTMIPLTVEDIRTKQSVGAVITYRDGVSQEAVTELERGKTYMVHASISTPGYFQPSDLTVTIPLELTPMPAYTMHAVPFAVQVDAIDQETGDPVDMKYEIHDVNGSLLNSISAGTTVIFHETQWADGYDTAPDQTLTIPANEEQPQTYHITFTHAPFVEAFIKAPAGTLIGLYTDAACTQQAKDRSGYTAVKETDQSGVTSYSLRNGIYYAKEKSTPAGYRADSSIKKIICDRSENPSVSVSFYHEKITLEVISTKDDQPLSGVKYSLYEQGELKQEWNSTGDDVPDAILSAGHTYEVTASTEGQYLFESTQSVTIPETGESQTLTFTYEPFTVLHLRMDQQADVKGALYTSAEGEDIADDVAGHPCALNETFSWKVRPGTYWFRSNPSSHYYQNVTKIDVAETETQEERIDLEEADITIEIENVADEAHLLELFDENGTLIKTWNAEGDTSLNSRKLEPGRSYVIKDKDTGDETEFTLPEQKPEEQPVVKVAPQEEPESVADEKEAPKVFWMAGGAFGLIALAGGGAFFYRRKK